MDSVDIVHGLAFQYSSRTMSTESMDFLQMPGFKFYDNCNIFFLFLIFVVVYKVHFLFHLTGCLSNLVITLTVYNGLLMAIYCYGNSKIAQPCHSKKTQTIVYLTQNILTASKAHKLPSRSHCLAQGSCRLLSHWSAAFPPGSGKSPYGRMLPTSLCGLDVTSEA